SRKLPSSLFRFVIVTADENVAIDRAILRQQLGAEILEGCSQAHSVGQQLLGLLRRGALPNAERARSRTADRCGERYGCIDDNRASLPDALELLEKRGLAGKRDRQHANVARPRRSVIHAFNQRRLSDTLAQLL